MDECGLCGASGNMLLLEEGVTYYRIVRCKSCGLVYANPSPSPEEIRGFYNSDYTYFTSSYEASYSARDYRKALEVLGEAARLCGPGRLLDVGCATGALLAAAQQKGWNPEGVEISEDASAATRKKGFIVHTGTLANIRLEPGSYNAITMMDSLEHMQHPLESLNKANLLLKPDGLLVIETPNFNSIYRRLIGRRWVGFNRFHIFFFTPSTISGILAASGFKIAKLLTTNADIVSRDALFRWGVRDAVSKVIGKGRKPAAAKDGISDTSAGGDNSLDLIEKLMNLPFAAVLNQFKLGDQIRVYARKTA